MISYKNYKLLNEALGQSFTLGVRSIPAVGIVGSNFADIEQTLEEAKKKCASKKCSKMNGDEEPEAEEAPDVEDKVDKKLGKKDDEPEENEEPEGDEPEEKDEPEDKGEPEKKDEPEDKGESEEKDEPEGDEPEEKPTLFQKKQKAKQKKNMKKEDVEFFQSLAKQLGTSTISQKFWDGISEQS